LQRDALILDPLQNISQELEIAFGGNDGFFKPFHQPVLAFVTFLWLETAKEELQSTNEELTTLNDKLSNRNLEMMQLTSDLDNLLTNVQIPIVMVDRTLMVRRATPAARNALNILPTDIGRRITELRPNIDIPDLENILRDVTETLNMRERKVTDLEGRGYSSRVRPYRTTDNKIDGAVITLVDLEGRKESDAGKTPNRAKQGSPRK
jgi:two-component system CheB/CheR fusion protein